MGLSTSCWALLRYFWTAAGKLARVRGGHEWEERILAQKSDEAGTSEWKLSEQWSKNSQIPPVGGIVWGRGRW